MHKKIVEYYAPHMLPLIRSKKVGVYPLQLIRALEKKYGTEWTKEFVRLCRKHDVKKSVFKSVVATGKEIELFERLKALENTIQEAKQEISRGRKPKL
ncbi:hypothetical protein JCM9492_13420 [Aquifex pyrophilus]